MTSKKRKHDDQDEPVLEERRDPIGERFDRAWELLAGGGVCDDQGGAEQERVREEWRAANCPEPLLSFIRRHANSPPKPKE